MRMTKTLSALLIVFGMTAPAFADHPRREQVNSRLANQNRRIDNGVANGTLSHGQARQLHREDHAIRAEERTDAATHGGHITKAEQRQINRQENQVSRQIYAEKH